jgi:hypothetical protein
LKIFERQLVLLLTVGGSKKGGTFNTKLDLKSAAADDLPPTVFEK